MIQWETSLFLLICSCVQKMFSKTMMSMVSCLCPLLKEKAPRKPFVYPFDDAEVLRLSEAAIAEACKIAPPVYALGKNWKHVVRLSNNILVKFGRFIELAEARNMQFVYENEPLVRVPKCFRSFQVEDKDSTSVSSTITYIVMEYIPGTVLSDCWDKISENRRQNVCDKVVEAICKLQQLHVQRPGPIGGGLCRAPNELFSLAGAGPFSSIADIEKWYSHRLWLCKRMGRVQAIVRRLKARSATAWSCPTLILPCETSSYKPMTRFV
jgi:hypothetical protein